ncbi:MAG: carbon-nitrogen hydrolase family protein [bacterium]|nr:carbon-nitrogen hydrolase family protein [bacterium]
MKQYEKFVLAVVQADPVYLDVDASTDKACSLIKEAGQKGAALVAFGETWLTGYPFIWSQSFPADVRIAYLANAVEIPSPATDRLCRAAQQADLDVVIGVAERDSRTQGTVYCTVLFIGREGVILGRHRKLKPTANERAIWGEGDAVGLTTYQRPYGRISGLNCWEHAMVLPGYALMAMGTQIHIATWPTPSVLSDQFWKGMLLSRTFAVQGSCFVLASCALNNPENVPEQFRDIYLKGVGESEYGSSIIAPGGDIIAQASSTEETIITASVSLEAVYRFKSVLDVGGHYSRPDILTLHINNHPIERIIQRSEARSGAPRANLFSTSDDASAPQSPEISEIDVTGTGGQTGGNT